MSRILSGEMIDCFGLHAFGVTRVRSGIFGTKCVCWFGRDDRNKDIRHAFRFYGDMKDAEGFRNMLKTAYKYSRY